MKLSSTVKRGLVRFRKHTMYIVNLDNLRNDFLFISCENSINCFNNRRH